MDAGDQGTLSDADRAVWHAFKRATETVTTAVERDILAAAGLTGAEFGVLDRLALHDGTMRQSDLGRSMYWNKSRFSTRSPACRNAASSPAARLAPRWQPSASPSRGSRRSHWHDRHMPAQSARTSSSH